MQIRKHPDPRVRKLADHIEFIQDRKYHIKPFEMAELIIQFLDNLQGQAYAHKIKESMVDTRSFHNKKQ